MILSHCPSPKRCLQAAAGCLPPPAPPPPPLLTPQVTPACVSSSSSSSSRPLTRECGTSLPSALPGSPPTLIFRSCAQTNSSHNASMHPISHCRYAVRSQCPLRILAHQVFCFSDVQPKCGLFLTIKIAVLTRKSGKSASLPRNYKRLPCTSCSSSARRSSSSS